MVTTKRPGLLACLKHRDYRRLISAFVLSDIGFWAYNVALAVWVFDATGSVTWVAAATICRFVPALVLSAYAGVLADRFEKVRLIVTMDLLFAAIMLVMALVMATDGPVWAVLATAAVSSSLGTAYEPAAAGLTPHVVPERDLASANAFRNTIDNITVIAGPALGAMLLLVGPPQVAVGINAGLFVASALVVRTLRVRSRAVDVTEGGEQGPLQQMLVGIKAILSSQTTALMVGYSVLATLVFGIDTVLFIAVSDELLGTGPDGYGYLLAGLGLGGVLAAPLATRAEARPFLGPIILAGMAAYTLPMLALLWTESPAVGFAVQVVRGAGTLFVDVLAVTALQRTLPNDVMARVFGAFNSLMLASILLGSTVTSAVIATAGVEAAVWISSLGVFAVSLLGLPWLRRMDRLSAARRAELAPRIELLEACDLFEQVGDGDLTQLAGDAEVLWVSPGEVVVREGDLADAFYVIVSGRLSVSAATGTRLDAPDMEAGEYFGEIGLIERIPRTATVTSATAAQLLRIDGTAFLEVLTTSRPSSAIIDSASVRLQRTHPTLALKREGLSQGETT